MLIMSAVSLILSNDTLYYEKHTFVVTLKPAYISVYSKYRYSYYIFGVTIKTQLAFYLQSRDYFKGFDLGNIYIILFKSCN